MDEKGKNKVTFQTRKTAFADEVIRRAGEDPAFREELLADPGAALMKAFGTEARPNLV
jgi:hypothetical protein